MYGSVTAYRSQETKAEGRKFEIYMPLSMQVAKPNTETLVALVSQLDNIE